MRVYFFPTKHDDIRQSPPDLMLPRTVLTLYTQQKKKETHHLDIRK